MKTLLLLALLSFSPAFLWATPQELFEQANQHYEQGETSQAMKIYLDLLDRGYDGFLLSYNLGNAFYRAGDRGRAVLWFERAWRQNPRDPDVQFNLNLARSHLKEQNTGLIEKVALFFGSNELAMTSLIAGWIFFLLTGALLLGWMRLSGGMVAVLWMSGCLFLVATGWLGAHLTISSRPWAIVVVPPGEVRNGPGTDYAVGFTVPEGSRVLILNRRPEWTQIGSPQEGLRGWIPTAHVHKI